MRDSTKLRIVVGLAGAIFMAPASPAAAAASAPLQIRVVVVATFEVGNDTGDVPGEFQNWVERYPLHDVLPFPQGYRSLRYNATDHVLGIVTGAGKASAAASIMALGLDPRFDLRKAYWILAGIGGIDPNRASIGSAVWASHVVDGDLAYEIDAREIPANWPTGIVAYDRATPFEQPAPPAVSDNGILAYDLNDGLATWAYGLTRNLVLQDDDKLKAARAGYLDPANAQRPPFVLMGDTLTADRFWIGAKMNEWAEKWVPYWTKGEGRFTTSAEEDAAYLQALTFLAHAGRADLARALDLRTGSDFTMPPKGVSAADLLKSEATGNYAAYNEAIENAYVVGSSVVRELAQHWPIYERSAPMARP
ncbi:MAG: purine nucleoside permease [Candidatus Sulfotelmatobacter sp.]|jgi:purine nucleoside permease